MNKKIFRSTMLVALLVLFLSVALILGILVDFFEQRTQSELRSDALLLSHTLDDYGIEILSSLDDIDKRITLIAADGTVILDTLEDVASLDNHSDRTEVRAAISNGIGVSRRYSLTRMEKTLYCAVMLKNGDILRLSTTQYSTLSILLALIHPLAIVFIIAFIVSYFLSSHISNSIVKPINAINLDNPVFDDNYEELTPLLHKISIQKQTIAQRIKEAELRREEFRLITEQMSEGFITIDVSGSVLTYNTAALQLLNIKNPENCNILTLPHARNLRETALSALNGNHTRSEINLDTHIYNLIANPVFEDGKTIGAIIIILDITETFKQEQLRREFTSNVSHELKTPLTSISGFAEIMKSGSPDRETVMDFSSSIYDEAQRLITLVNDIIKLSELDEGSLQLSKTEVDLFSLAKETVIRLSPNADKANVALNLSGEQATVYGSKNLLDEMLYNLCDNAIKYNIPGGSVNIEVGKRENSVVLTVRDTGIGIPQTEQARVFERFYRVDKSHSKEVGGTGLGLSIVKHSAIYHNAKITLESSLGKGTSFTIVF